MEDVECEVHNRVVAFLNIVVLEDDLAPATPGFLAEGVASTVL